MEEPKDFISDRHLEADSAKILSLKDLALGCERLLKTLSTNEDADNTPVLESQNHWAARELSEFNIWCVKVGVYGEGLRSIDVRLKDVPEICNVLKQLLQSLRNNLYELQRGGDNLTKPIGTMPETSTKAKDLEEKDDCDSDSSSLSFKTLSSSDLGSEKAPERTRGFMLQNHIEDTIDRLHGHARQIHSAGARHRMERIRRYQEKPELRGVYGYFKELCMRRMANDSFKLASDVLKDRVAESFARRRIRFKYLEEHQKKRNVELKPQTKPTLHRRVLEQALRPSLSSPLGQIPQQKQHDNIRHSFHDHASTVLSGTVNTKLDLKSIRKPQLERPESVASVAFRTSEFPAPPKPFRGKFQCSYCRLEFAAREAEKNRWSRHVMQDFEPYFCLVEECKYPFDVPNSFDGLLAHMQEQHIPFRYHVDLPDGEHRELDDAEFEAHINRSSGKVSEDTMAALKEACRRRGVFLFESCPFCGGYPDDVEKEFPDRDKPEAQSSLRSHIKRHMQQAALFCPPHTDDLALAEGEDQGSAVAAQRSDAQSISEDPDQFVTLCNRPDCKDCTTSGQYQHDSGPPDMDTDEDFWVDFHNPVDGLHLAYDRSPVPDDYFLREKFAHLHAFQSNDEPTLPNTKQARDSEEGMIFAEDLRSYSTSLVPVDELEGLLFRKFDPIGGRYNRVVVHWQHMDIAHGYYSDENKSPCTLVVLRFHLDPNGPANHIREAKIEIVFLGMEYAQADPEVVAMYPDRMVSVQVEPTKQHETTVKAGDPTLGGDLAWAKARLQMKLKGISQSASGAIKVWGHVGSIRGEKNGLCWNVWGGTSEAKKGIALSIQTAVLLKHRSLDRFRSAVTITVHTVRTDSLAPFHPCLSGDELVVYDTNHQPPSSDRLQNYDVGNLGKVNLESLGDVTLLPWAPAP